MDNDLFSIWLITIIALPFMVLCIILYVVDLYLTNEAIREELEFDRKSRRSLSIPRPPAPYKTDDEDNQLRRDIEEYVISLHLELDRD